MTNFQKELCRFGEEFKIDLYNEWKKPIYRDKLSIFFGRNIKFQKNYQAKYNYIAQIYAGYNKRKFDQNKNIIPVFPAFAAERIRSASDHEKSIDDLTNKLSCKSYERALSEEDWINKFGNVADPEAFAIVNNLIAKTHKDIKPVEVNIEFPRSGNHNYRRNGKPVGRYRRV